MHYKVIYYFYYLPVWDNFLKCLVDGNIFMIITARGHEPKSIRKSVEWIIFNYLTESQREEMVDNLKYYNEIFNISETIKSYNTIIGEYLDLCDFIGVQSSYFLKKFDMEGSTGSPEQGKEIAIGCFVKKVNEYGKLINSSVSVGFSDDDLGTVNHIHSFIKEKLSLDIPTVKYKLYYTKDGIEEVEI